MTGSSYTAVRVEGGLLSADLIERIMGADRELKGNRPEDYHLAAGERLGEAASRKWEYLSGAYRTFKERLNALPETDPATRETRERWLLRLFDELGFGRLTYIRGGIEAGEKTYPISHQWSENLAIHLLGWHTDLDTRSGAKSEASRAPQSMLQEFLNTSDPHLWAVLSNGRVLRILRDSKALVGSAYVEFDLETIFDGDLYSEFVLLFALLHSSRFEPLPREDGGDPTSADCWLERWRNHAIETGTRAREQLRKGVELALNELGTGFLESNTKLREDLASGRLTREDFHHELLRLAYQLIFLFVVEDRNALLIPDPDDASPEQISELKAARERYAEYFSTSRLRRIASRRRGDRHTDLWRTLVVVLDALGADDGRPELALPALGGLFFRAGDPLASDGLAPDLLRACDLTNERLLAAVRHFSTFKDKKGRTNRVDYQHLDAEELGSVYESLLELDPRIDGAEPRFWLKELPGNKRKTTGSYYTPTSLIDELLKTTLDPIIEDHASLRHHPDDLLKITVCDPACGSGHFLVAAARRIAKKYAEMRTDDEEPTPSTIREAMHKVVRNCVYGVDINPLAAELAKVSLWLESLQPGRPLAFLDAHIKVGNSLLGTTPRLLLQGIPDEAYKPIGEDDKKVAAQLRKENASERGGQLEIKDSLFDLPPTPEDTAPLTHEANALNRMRVGSIADIREQARRFRALLASPDLKRRKRIADAWCAAFVCRKDPSAPRAITSATLKVIGGDEEAGRLHARAVPTAVLEKELDDLIEQYSFFHWHLEFPDIFRVGDDGARDDNPGTSWQGGFSCVLGNPPWERVKLQEQEFFASRSEKIANALNASERKRLIQELESSGDGADRDLYESFQAELRRATGWSQLLRSSGRYPLTGRGDVNTYSVFAETARTIIGPSSRSGMVLPTGIATDATTAPFFGDLVSERSLVAFLEFENEEFLLSRDVHHSFRFCLLSMAGRESKIAEAEFAFGSRRISDIENRRFGIPSEEIILLNPNTRTAPLFRSRRDAEITLGIYRRVPVLWRESPRSNPWGLSFMRMFDMANDSDLFHKQVDLEAEGWKLAGNIFVRNNERMVPLYEAKMMHHFDHRLGTYQGQTEAQANMGTLPRLTEEQKSDPECTILPRYWISEMEVDKKLDGRWNRPWLIGFRKICRATDERTLVASVFPRAGFGDSGNLIFPTNERMHLIYAAASSFVLDYILRQKMAGTNLNFFQFQQLPFHGPEVYESCAEWDGQVELHAWISARILELAYTAVDMSPFAQEFGDDGPPFVWSDDRRCVLRAELDAAYFHLYGVERDDVGFILDSFGAFQRNDPGRFARTKALILEVYDAMARAAETGEQYKTLLDPQPGYGPRHPDAQARSVQ